MLGGFLWAAFTVGREADEEYGDSPLSKNQWRLLGWVVAIGIALVATIIEYYIVIK